MAVLEHKISLPQPPSEQAAGGQREQRLDYLVALVRRVLPRVQPYVHAEPNMRKDFIKKGGTRDEQHQTDHYVEEPPRGHAHQREERPEEEQAGPQVFHEDHERHRQRPDAEQRRQVAKGRNRHSQDPPGAHGKYLSHVLEIRCEKDDQQDLGEFPRLKADRPQMDPELRPVDVTPEHGGEDQQQDSRDAYQETVVAEDPQIPHEDQHEQKHHEPHDQPQGLLKRQPLVDAVDDEDAESGEQRGHRQEIGIGVGSEDSTAYVRDGEQRQEYHAIQQRVPGERGGFLRVDEGESHGSEEHRRDDPIGQKFRAEVSRDLGEPMVGRQISSIPKEELIAGRGW